MAMYERPREQPPDHGLRQALRQSSARQRVLDEILVQALPIVDGLDPMGMPPDSERTPDLLVAELPSRDVTVVASFPAHAHGTDADGEHDDAAVPQATRLPLDSHESA